VNKKSVCIDARLISAPGIGTYLKNLFSQLRGTPWKWYALVHRDQEIADYIEPIVISSKIYSVSEQCALPVTIPRVDVFWSPHYNVPVMPIQARKRLVSIHDAFHLAFAEHLRPVERIYARWMMKRALRLSDHVITCSEFSKKEMQIYTGIERPISVIPYGVDESTFYAGASDKGVMKKYAIEGPFLLYVGSLKKHKNVRGLIEAFWLLVKRGRDVKLVVVGSGSERYSEDVKQLCIAYPELEGKVRFTGHVPDEELGHFYRSAQLFVFPSFYEGFGFPPLEAMRSGCPTVAALAGALPEVCGEGAVYVNPYTPDQMALVMEELLKDNVKRNTLVAMGLQRSRQFCWKKCAEEHCAVMERLM
jgi:glycosyltransferase involved in cell wall biosynthesis